MENRGTIADTVRLCSSSITAVAALFPSRRYVTRVFRRKQPAKTTSNMTESTTVQATKRQPIDNVRGRLEELCKKRFFYAPAFSIYGGVAGLYDYGPPGCALQANILSLWRSHFIHEENMLEVDCTIMSPHDVLKTSGHVDRFTDFMVRDTVTGDVYRADHILEAALERKLKDEATPAEQKKECEEILAQIDNYNGEQLDELIARFQVRSDAGNVLSKAAAFNLMFGTEIGPTGYIKGFLRPETAQGQFVNFKRLLECNNDRMPFASAMIGRSFRNEISPRSGLLRVREFTMAEVEHYVHPEKKDHARFHEVADIVLNFLPAATQQAGSSTLTRMSVGEAVKSKMVNNQTLGYFLARTALFLQRIGVDADRLRFRQHMQNEMAHYASDCWDAEIQNSYGWIECVGCADRACYDLSMHTKATGEKLVARERLAEPIRRRVRRIEVDRKLIGQAFKRDSAAVVAYFEGLSEEEAVKTVFPVTVPLPDGRSVSVSGDMAKLVDVEEVVHVLEYIPSVIEPSFGIGRIIYSLLEHSFWCREGDEQRYVLSLPAIVAPTKCLVAPLSPNDDFRPVCLDLVKALRRKGIACTMDDSSTSIGKRYARNDEIGIPFAVTVDFQTLKDGTVTVRERDSTEQVRVPVEEIPTFLHSLIEGHLSWAESVERLGGLFAQQSL